MEDTTFRRWQDDPNTILANHPQLVVLYGRMENLEVRVPTFKSSQVYATNLGPERQKLHARGAIVSALFHHRLDELRFPP